MAYILDDGLWEPCFVSNDCSSCSQQPLTTTEVLCLLNVQPTSTLYKSLVSDASIVFVNLSDFTVFAIVSFINFICRKKALENMSNLPNWVLNFDRNK